MLRRFIEWWKTPVKQWLVVTDKLGYPVRDVRVLKETEHARLTQTWVLEREVTTGAERWMPMYAGTSSWELKKGG
jgi:hypothetical protein